MTAQLETTVAGWPDINELPTASAPVEAHYEGVRKAFWTTNDRGGWVEVNEQSLRRLLRAQGFRGGKLLNGERLTPLEQRLSEIQTQHDVAYAGAARRASQRPY